MPLRLVRIFLRMKPRIRFAFVVIFCICWFQFRWLIQLADELARNLTSYHETYLVLLDFSKAFDKVSHTPLLYKLHQHGITRNNLIIRPSFPGVHNVWLWKGKLVWNPSHFGWFLKVGPILFLLYINDLPENIHSEVRLLADDTAKYLTINSKADCQTLQQDLHKLEIWGKDWEMEFNPSKCQVLHIIRPRTSVRHQYVLHGQVLETVDHAKYLGLKI